jgi:hypothetical protein
MDATRRDEIKELARRVLVEPETIWPEKVTAYLMAQAMCHSSEELDLLCKEVELLQLVLENEQRAAKTLPPPPERRDFRTQEQYEEALAYWQQSVGRIEGLVARSKGDRAGNGFDELSACKDR